jgi:hypothetical protein
MQFEAGIQLVEADLAQPIAGYQEPGPRKPAPACRVREIDELYELREELETMAVRSATPRYGSRPGRAWMAVSEDETSAAAMGENTVRIKLLASIGASFSGFAGASTAPSCRS